MKVFSRTLGLLLVMSGVSPAYAQQAPVRFDVCVYSDVWTRPSAAAQSRIWNDPRYREHGPAAYEWTHQFLWSEPDSASLSYHSANESGLWTDLRTSQCPRRDTERSSWRELWTLNWRVTGVFLNGLVYTIAVTPLNPGYEIVQLREPADVRAAKPTFRVIDQDGRVHAEWVESTPGLLSPLR